MIFSFSIDLHQILHFDLHQSFFCFYFFQYCVAGLGSTPHSLTQPENPPVLFLFKKLCTFCFFPDECQFFFFYFASNDQNYVKLDDHRTKKIFRRTKEIFFFSIIFPSKVPNLLVVLLKSFILRFCAIDTYGVPRLPMMGTRIQILSIFNFGFILFPIFNFSIIFFF